MKHDSTGWCDAAVPERERTVRRRTVHGGSFTAKSGGLTFVASAAALKGQFKKSSEGLFTFLRNG
ncbi:hypothetical protein [Caballeronia sp. Lep1P3]|uniref:hypothetical protein n=1 Tax=Caballeronia sp. Lep1P3 TaxID=2878150 RepID=UPI001FD2C946|nr:hypothetical protein [Caballeronia sp. Lep1P3]